MSRKSDVTRFSAGKVVSILAAVLLAVAGFAVAFDSISNSNALEKSSSDPHLITGENSDLGGATLTTAQDEGGNKYLSDILGISRQQFVDYLDAHKVAYLDTPYKSDWPYPTAYETGPWWSNGNHPYETDGYNSFSNSGYGMNCAGFPARVWCDMGLENTSFMQQWKNAHSWMWANSETLRKTMLNQGVKYYTFNSINEMLSSGKLQKGDIIQMDSDSDKDDHVGIFWGNSSSDDKFWHSIFYRDSDTDGKNMISEIYGKMDSGIYYLFKFEPEKGWLEIWKTPTDLDAVKDNINYSLIGATYEIRKGTLDGEVVQTLSTVNVDDEPYYKGDYQSNWKSSWGNKSDWGYACSKWLDPGTYYVVETDSSPGYLIPNPAYVKVEVKACGTYEVNKAVDATFKEPPKTGIIKLQKSSAKPDWTWDSDFYSLAGAEYQVRDSSDVVVATLITDEEGKAQTGLLPLGTYKIKETSPSKGFRLDDTEYTCTLSEGTDTDAPIETLVQSPEEPQRGKIVLTKKPGSTESLDFDTYSLEGAQYQIIDEKGKVWETLTTNVYGSATSMDIPLGNYIVKEILSPQGYDVDITPIAVSITEDKLSKDVNHVDYETTTDEPTIAKKQDTNVDEIGTLTGVQGAATLLDATYRLTYYDGYYTTFDQIENLTPKKTSTMKTKMGVGIYGGEAILELGPENMIYNGKEWYLPLGTYKLEEIEAPEGYNLDINSYLFQCKYDENRVVRIYLQPTPGAEASIGIDQAIGAGNLIVSHETVKRGDVSIMKYIEDTTDPDKYPDKKHPCEGVKFRIINDNDYPVLNVVTGKPVYKGEVVYELTTNAEGYASTRDEITEAGRTGIINNYDPTKQAPNALAYGNYIIEEDPTTTPAGYIPIEKYRFSINANFYYHNVTFENKTGTVVRVNKIDNETKLNVRGITRFEVLDSDMNVMEFTKTYPSNAVISVFETGIDGTAIIPEKLLMGTYYIREVAAPNGYLHTPELVEFKIDSSTVNDYDHPYDVCLGDDPAKGKVIITKKDADTGGTITAAPAVFDIYADADIVTQDGTVRHKKDDLVETITTVNGVATSGELFIGHYRAVEVTAPTGYLLNTEPVKFDIVYEGDKNGVADKLSYTRCDMSDVAVLGGIVIRKTDADSNGLITRDSAMFEVRATENITGGDGHIWASKGQVVATVNTVNGIARTDMNLHLGKYEVIEIESPYGYILDSNPVPVELVYADQYTPVVSSTAVKANRYSPVDYRLAKLDRETGKPVWKPSCEIGIYAAEDIVMGDGRLFAAANKLIGSAITDESGYVTSELNLPVGRYYLKELHAPAGYVLDTDKTYAVEAIWDNGVSNHHVIAASISDVPAKGTITFTKADAETGKTIPVAGIKAQVIANEDIATGDGTIRAHKDEVVAELETDASGIAQSSELYLGSYRVIETLAPEGYLINEVPVNVELVYENQNIPVITRPSQIFDENAKGIIEVTKIDRETSNVIPIAGTTFEVRAKSDIMTPDGTVRVPAGELACEPIVTDDTGKAVTSPLYIGTYTIIETQAPHGYVLDETPHDVVIAYKDQHTSLTLTSSSVDNIAQKGVVQVTKLDAESGLAVLAAGAKFEIKAVEDIYTGDGTKRVSEGEVVDIIETDEKGVSISKALYLGKYEIREIEAPRGYLLSDEVKQIELVYGDQVQSVVYGIQSIVDQSVRGIISIHKTDADTGESLGGVKFEVRAKNDIVGGDGVIRHEAGAVVAELVTDENGNASTGELYLGDYVIVEVSQLDGYKLDTAEHVVTLAYADQMTPVVFEEMELVNEPTSVTVKKVSTSEAALTVPDTKFVGWLASDESDIKAPFAVFTTDTADISSVSVTYDEPLLASDNEQFESKSFELSRVNEATGYVLYTSNEPLSTGKYTLAISYKVNGIDKTAAMPFTVNEHDSSAVFAIGGDIIASGEDANCFAHTTRAISVDNPNPSDSPSDSDVKTDEDGNMESSETDGSADNENNDADNVRPVVDEDKDDSISDDTGVMLPDSPNEDAGVLDDVVIVRVPVILSQGKFTYAVTDGDGMAEFKYVPQGRSGFAELSPVDGFVSDRAPAYVDVPTDGITASFETSDNVEPLGMGALGFTFTDNQTKLHISKRDITTNEELPGNVLSVYRYKESGEENELSDANYGELIDSWVSKDEPHLMELLPQGTYILKEEKAVEGYTVAESIKFNLNDTGVEQQVIMNNEREAGVADEFIGTNPIPLAELILTGDPFKLAVIIVIVIASIGGIMFVRSVSRE